MLGKKATRLAVASTVAEPVFSVNHQMRAKRTSALPTSENACAVQIVKNRSFHAGELNLMSCLFCWL
jgi:hypothetical protein